MSTRHFARRSEGRLGHPTRGRRTQALQPVARATHRTTMSPGSRAWPTIYTRLRKRLFPLVRECSITEAALIATGRLDATPLNSSLWDTAPLLRCYGARPRPLPLAGSHQTEWRPHRSRGRELFRPAGLWSPVGTGIRQLGSRRQFASNQPGEEIAREPEVGCATMTIPTSSTPMSDLVGCTCGPFERERSAAVLDAGLPEGNRNLSVSRLMPPLEISR